MAQTAPTRFVRIAELQIDPAQLEAFAAATREVGRASVAREEGCVALYAVAEKDNPAYVRVFEVYRDAAAYQAHLQTAHFKTFRDTTQAMVTSRRLTDATPISLATKPGKNAVRVAPARGLAAVATLFSITFGYPALADTPVHTKEIRMTTEQTLSSKQRAIAPIAAATAVGDMPKLTSALNAAFDAGLSVSDAKEILVQLYAYTGFPRSLNALGELMKVVDSRKQRGINDAPGSDPGPVPTGAELRSLGTANQTKLSGAPVKGPLFEFAPAIDEYLKTHLFGDIFARDNLDWQSRELATVGALAALPGAESQLRSHIRISMNVGLTASQLAGATDALAQSGQSEAASRLRTELGERAETAAPTAEQQITRAGSQASTAGPSDYFTGRVRVEPVWSAEGGINTSGGMVSFDPGARSAWHTHPLGQRLLVVSGVGLTQEWGKPVQVIRAGDVVSCPPGVKHWHGAAPATAMTHLAVTGTLDGGNVKWMEKVSDEQYAQGTP